MNRKDDLGAAVSETARRAITVLALIASTLIVALISGCSSDSGTVGSASGEGFDGERLDTGSWAALRRKIIDFNTISDKGLPCLDRLKPADPSKVDAITACVAPRQARVKAAGTSLLQTIDKYHQASPASTPCEQALGTLSVAIDKQLRAVDAWYESIKAIDEAGFNDANARIEVAVPASAAANNDLNRECRAVRRG